MVRKNRSANGSVFEQALKTAQGTKSKPLRTRFPRSVIGSEQLAIFDAILLAFVPSERLGCGSRIVEINIAKLLPVRVLHDEARELSEFFGGPRWWETLRH